MIDAFGISASDDSSCKADNIPKALHKTCLLDDGSLFIDIDTESDFINFYADNCENQVSCEIPLKQLMNESLSDECYRLTKSRLKASVYNLD